VATLAAELADPGVVAVYTQTLSYTDGISDDLPAILEVGAKTKEKQNQKQVRKAGGSTKASSKRD